MKAFMDDNFLLTSEVAQKLYHDYAKEMPIFDYHCHVNVSEIAADKKYRNITELWLGGDHYKWRAMRLFGIDEAYITGDKSDFEKFYAYSEMIAYAIGNPLYHWTHLELQRYFGITETLCPETAQSIYDRANAMLAEGLTTRKLIAMSNVTKLCSTDDPIDDLRYHKQLLEEGYAVQVMPTFRPDKILEIRAETFLPYMAKLADVMGHALPSYQDLLDAIVVRMEYFAQAGCKLSDHSVSEMPYADTSLEAVSAIYAKAMAGESLTADEETAYRFYTFRFLANQYEARRWTMQLHLGALRNNNPNMFAKLGADTGFDSMDDRNIAASLSRFLGACCAEGLPKTVIYTLNPKDNYVLGTMMGNFAAETTIPTKVQFGTAWWFNDQRDGMVDQMRAYANLGMISKFLGMLTDSRSFTSYTRHEYFRRILCEFLGGLVENGEFPCNYTVLGKIVQDICYNNICNYFEA